MKAHYASSWPLGPAIRLALRGLAQALERELGVAGLVQDLPILESSSDSSPE